MIRKANNTDLNRLMEIWLNGNLEAHDFISASYWKDNFDEVKSALMQADIFVYEKDDEILGFIGMSGNYLAGIFVDSKYRGHGVGTKLLNFIKQNYDSFSLSVYEKNKKAIDFYLNQGMKISTSDIDQDTNEKEYTMIFEK